ncbi:AMP-binding protein [Asticcacaulis biprosthecium]|nr:AMP-binding protein [Asticcacaulis biprosthecium]
MKSQLAARQTVVAYQQGLLEKLCRHARRHVPFYRDTGRLEPLFDGDRFDMSRWEQVPVLTREEAYLNRDGLVSEGVPRFMAPIQPGQTTGSTGTPLPFLRTAPSRYVSEALTARALAWRGLSEPRPAAISKAVTGDVAGKEAGAPLTASGSVHFVDFFLPPRAQCAELIRIRPRLVISYPSIVHSWILADGGACLEGVEAILLTGETCREETARAIAAAYGGHLINLYSCSEAGPMAIQGPKGDLKVCEENLWLEAPPTVTQAKANLRPHPVIITPFYAYATPLIRYAPGDYAIWGKPDKATPGLRALERITGRLRNMFKRADGSLFWPNLSGVKLMKIAPHTHRQLIQETIGRFVIRVVFDAPPTDDQVRQIQSHVAEVTGATEVVVDAVSSIDDGRTSGKSYENFICLI